MFESLGKTILLAYFFFQAEDGIRDVAVTGVQTCALPIFVEISEALQGGALRFVRGQSILDVGARSHGNMEAQFCLNFTGDLIVMQTGANEIGRASCRERV